MGIDDMGIFYIFIDIFFYVVEDYQLADLQQEMESNNVELCNEYINWELLFINICLQEVVFKFMVQINVGVIYNVGIFFGE